MRGGGIWSLWGPPPPNVYPTWKDWSVLSEVMFWRADRNKTRFVINNAFQTNKNIKHKKLTDNNYFTLNF